MEDFIKHIEDENPSFLCYENSDESESLNLKVKVTHEINRSCDQDALIEFDKFISSNGKQLRDFYAKMNGIKMYCQNGQPKIEFFPIKSWKDENEAWQYNYEGMESDELYDFQKHGIAFGEISQSGNYFVFFEGRIYYADHDEWEEIILGNDFFEFLNHIIKDPSKFMYDRGCYSRFEDGKTKIQWIPKVYSNE